MQAMATKPPQLLPTQQQQPQQRVMSMGAAALRHKFSQAAAVRPQAPPAASYAMDQLKKTADRLVEDQEANRQHVEIYKKKHQESLQENTRLKADLTTKREEIAVLRAKLQDDQRHIQMVNDKMRAVQALHDTVTLQLEELSTSVVKGAGREQQLSSSYESVAACFQETRALVDHLAEEKKHLEHELATALALAAERDAAAARLEAQIKSEQNAREAAVSTEAAARMELAIELKQAAAKLAEDEQKLQALQLELQATSATSAALQHEHATAVQQKLELETQMNAELTNLQSTTTERDVLRAEAQLQAAQLTQLKELLQAAEAARDTLAEQLPVLQQAKETQAQSLESLQEAHQQEKSDLEAKLAGLSNELATVKSSAAKTVSSLEGQLRGATLAADQRLNELCEMSSKEFDKMRADHKAEVAALKAKLEQHETAVTEDATTKMRELQELRIQCEAKDQQIVELKAQHAARLKKRDSDMEQLNAQKQELRQLKKDAEERLEQQVTDAKNQLAQADHQRQQQEADHQCSMQKLQVEARDSNATLAQLRCQLTLKEELFNKQLLKEQTACCDLQKQVQALTADGDSMHARLVEKQQEIDRLVEEACRKAAVFQQLGAEFAGAAHAQPPQNNVAQRPSASSRERMAAVPGSKVPSTKQKARQSMPEVPCLCATEKADVWSDLENDEEQPADRPGQHRSSGAAVLKPKALAPAPSRGRVMHSGPTMVRANAARPNSPVPSQADKRQAPRAHSPAKTTDSKRVKTAARPGRRHLLSGMSMQQSQDSLPRQAPHYTTPVQGAKAAVKKNYTADTARKQQEFEENYMSAAQDIFGGLSPYSYNPSL